MKTEIHKGIVILRDPKTGQYYTEVVIGRTPTGKIQYTAAKKIERVRMDIDRFFAVLKKKRSKPRLVWVRGKYIDSHFNVAEIIFQDKEAKIITVRNVKGGMIQTISLSNYKFDIPKVFNYTGPNSKVILLINMEQSKIGLAKERRAKATGLLTPFESKSLK